jgi:hypothetical protein
MGLALSVIALVGLVIFVIGAIIFLASKGGSIIMITGAVVYAVAQIILLLVGLIH